MSDALAGVRVLDLTTNLPGPYCTRLLASFGAEVVKLERPGRGDDARRMPDFFAALNRGKRGLALDLGRAEARAALARLAERVDVVVEGFRPGVAARLGADYATLAAVNSRLVYCSITEFGQWGPRRDEAGHDLNYQALTGLLEAAGEGRSPAIPRLVLSDLASGLFAVAAVLAGLQQRLSTGEGSYWDVSMTDTLLNWAAMNDLLRAPPAFSRGTREEVPIHLLEALPHYGLFETADGQWLAVGIVHEDHFWRALCARLGLEGLAGLTQAERAGRGAELRGVLALVFRQRTLAAWQEQLAGADVAATPILSLAEAAADPHFAARGVLRRVASPAERPLFDPQNPLLTEAGRGDPGAVPRLGEHTHEVLAGAGLAPAEIAALAAAGAIPLEQA